MNAGIGHETRKENRRREMSTEETWSKVGHMGQGSRKKIMAGWKGIRALRDEREEGESSKTDFS